MKKKKILFVLHQLNHGGVQNSALTALNAIDYDQNEVTLYIRKNRTDLIDRVNPSVKQIIVNKDKTHYYRKPGIAILLIAKLFMQFFRCRHLEDIFQKMLVREINKQQMNYEKSNYFDELMEYDVAISYIQGYTAKFVAKYVTAKKKIMFYHGSTDETHELHEEIMSDYDAVVGVNDSIKNILSELYPVYAHKMTSLRNYVDAKSVREKSVLFEVPRDDNRIILCSCGRLTPVKGFDLAVEAARLMKEKDILFKWYFVGDGPERNQIEKMIEEYQLKEYIETTGMQDNPYPYIAACDIYVQPSYEEAQPLTIMEAQILNRPVVSTETVGGKSLITSNINGVLVEIDALKMSNAISRIIKMSELRERIIKDLSSVDYSNTWLEYQDGWARLIGD